MDILQTRCGTNFFTDVAKDTKRYRIIMDLVLADFMYGRIDLYSSAN